MKQRHTGSRRIAAAAGCAIAIAGLVSVSAKVDDDKKARPSITVRSNPQGGFSPLRVVLTAEIKGGADDFEEYYCPSIEWNWDDGTKSESKGDCDPYEPGKSEIKRRYTIDRVYQIGGEYNIEFRLKQKNKTVGMGKTLLRIRPGVRDPG